MVRQYSHQSAWHDVASSEPYALIPLCFNFQIDCGADTAIHGLVVLPSSRLDSYQVLISGITLSTNVRSDRRTSSNAMPPKLGETPKMKSPSNSRRSRSLSRMRAGSPQMLASR